jgi:hygromycin-B 4-O-kinase
MSTHKAKIEGNIVQEFLIEHFNPASIQVEPIIGGESSQAFIFRVGSEEYVIRVSMSDEGFKKDAYAFKHFSAAHLPIPRVIEMGTLCGMFFAISEKVPGEWVQNLSKDEYVTVLPDLLEKLASVHAADISGTVGMENGAVMARGNTLHGRSSSFL